MSINDVTANNENAANSQFTITLSEASEQDITVSYATSDGTATAGADYTAISATQLTIAAGATTATFNVGVLADSLDEANETVTLTLSSAGNATISDAIGILTITDDDATPSVDFNATSSNGAESASSKALTVDLSAASGRDVTVNYAITGTATGSGTDFTLANGTLTISAGDTSGTITIASIINDTLDEANETVIVTLSSPGNATLGSDKTHTYTINDNDATPSLSINDVSGNETAGNRQFTVTLSAASGLAVTVNYATSDGTATAGADYTAISATQLTIAAGATTATFNVGVLADSLDEANETVTLTLSSASSSASISDATGTLTITDDDATPSLSIADVSGNETAGNRQFTVTLSAAAGRDVTVNYATSDGTATAGADYTATSGTLTIAAGATTATFNVGVLADSLDEANETVTLTLSSATNASISDATATLTITDDDATPSLSIADVSGNETAGNRQFTVTLSAASGLAVTVNYATSDGTATAGADYTAISATQLTIAAGATTATFNVGVLADSLDEANETVTLTLSGVSSTATISDATATLTITDDDATPSLSINDVSGNETAGNRQFTVTLSAASGLAVTVNYATSDGTATAGADYTAISATQLTIAAGATTATFNVGVLADSLDEANETVTLTLSSASSSASISDATGTLTITDDDATPSLSIADVSGNETAGNRQFTVTLSAAAGRDVTVNYATSDGTATAGADYTAISGSLTIAAGATTATFNVGVLADSLDEANETVTLTLSGVSSTATISDATATLTITDDDNPPSLSINDVTAANEDATNREFTVTLSAASSLEVTVNYATSDGTATAGADRAVSALQH